LSSKDRASLGLCWCWRRTKRSQFGPRCRLFSHKISRRVFDEATCNSRVCNTKGIRYAVREGQERPRNDDRSMTYFRTRPRSWRKHLSGTGHKALAVRSHFLQAFCSPALPPYRLMTRLLPILALQALAALPRLALAAEQDPPNHANSTVPYTTPSTPKYNYAEVIHKVCLLIQLVCYYSSCSRVCCSTILNDPERLDPTVVWLGAVTLA
jgi:hypothetical protein